jgi:hypothetical protein
VGWSPGATHDEQDCNSSRNTTPFAHANPKS